MAHMLAVTFAAAVVCTVAILGAQGSGQGTGQKGGSTIPLAPTLTLSGCVKPGATPGQFNLADATEVAKSGAAAATKKTYAIKGLMPPGVNLTQHMNHKVELTGTMGDPALAKGNMSEFNVTDFKMIAATCP